MADSPPIDRLSDDLLVFCLQSCPAHALGRLAATSARLGQLALCPVVFRGRGRPGLRSPAHLHLHETLDAEPTKMTVAHFHTGSVCLVQESRAGLESAAVLMKAHAELRCQVDGHVHPGAPEQVAVGYSRRRARAVEKVLVQCGVCPERIEITGWGKRIAEAEDWGFSPEFSRAELTYTLNGLTFPPRRALCLVLPEPSDTEDDMDETGSDSEDEGHYPLQVNWTIQLSQIQQVLVAHAQQVLGQLQNDTDDLDDDSDTSDDESDSDEEESEDDSEDDDNVESMEEA